MTPFAAWVLKLLILIAPPDKLVKMTKDPAAIETVEERTTRYVRIANAIDAAVHDPSIKSRFPLGPVEDAAVLVGIATWESGMFNKKVHLGLKTGDQGNSHCLTQQNIGSKPTDSTPKWNKEAQRFAWPNDPADQLMNGFTAEELKIDKNCFIAARRRMIVSMKTCWKKPKSGLLADYAGGKECEGKDAQEKSEQRMGTAAYLLKNIPPPKEGISGS